MPLVLHKALSKLTMKNVRLLSPNIIIIVCLLASNNYFHVVCEMSSVCEYFALFLFTRSFGITLN